jgi:signal peptidase II|tara:strand:+ start:65 stop:568 length:504 start_codon:yes stop_codon:yes gene_type:complete
MISFRYLNENKSLILNRGNIYSIILILLIFILDRFSKIEIINKFNDNTYILNDFLNIDLIWNTGIGFGLLSFDTSFIYNTITAVIALIILALFLTSLILKKIDKLIFSIILGGALGNIYDRVFYNAVPDFIDLHYSSFHWFTFNIADIFITLGIITFVAKDFFIKNK